jgi:hypothetical protein
MLLWCKNKKGLAIARPFVILLVHKLPIVIVVSCIRIEQIL